MNYSEFQPSDKLKRFVLNYWIFEIPKNENQEKTIRHISLPENSVSITLISQPNFRGVRLLGPHTKKFEKQIYSNTFYFGIRLLPWIVINSSLFQKEHILNTTDEAPKNLSTLFERNLIEDLSVYKTKIDIIEHILLSYLDSVEIEENDMVKYICINLEQGFEIKTIVKNIPCSIRVIQKKFKEVTGITMKQYSKNLRLRNLMLDVLLSSLNPTDVLYDHDYYDYSHFLNEFKKKMQLTPSDFIDYHRNIQIRIEH